MKKIASFTVDHLRLLRGVYVSRRDTTPSGDVIMLLELKEKGTAIFLTTHDMHEATLLCDNLAHQRRRG